ncbi:TPA: hypothetical protein NKS52_004828 [Vibrio parahaemolyticus]|uniref:hypothetical protein n=1 Tax=Vibrio parahaemolyticus TaxID=670 RepID=UPI00063E75AA|nr:hypothetical protein [Vibrio parahaemolyticus]KLI85638.1 hypothetical protein AAY62_08815 [Vibrio parahaemolyticus]MBE4145178.1 hypothetical protein [Vibrio parahaemolyticus]TBT43789.1 hypothetical protein D5E79_13215 [Vibrio parahaemolyticus]TOZ98937.1 hypothetical protein DXE04_03750 [Vibrio parahaemolyticus]HCH1564366.1 hypothetical protein [Vibrio parahaemolyticus]
MEIFDLKTSTLNECILKLIDDDNLKIKFLNFIIELNELFKDIDFNKQSIHKQHARYVLEERLQNDRELQLIVLKLRSAARREFLRAIAQEQNSIWIYYLIMVLADVVRPQHNKPIAMAK